MIYGYARVSTKGQSLQGQRVALRQAGAEKIVAEKASGTLTERPALDSLLAALQPGDRLLVTRLDRLGRSMGHLVATVEDLADRGVAFQSLHEAIDTTSANGKLMLAMFAALAQFERDLVAERTKAGLAAARAAGKPLGRPRVLTAAQEEAARQLRRQGYSYSRIGEALGCSKTVAYRAVER